MNMCVEMFTYMYAELHGYIYILTCMVAEFTCVSAYVYI